MSADNFIKRLENHFLKNNKSLLISNLQKTIRRQLTDNALRTAMVLIEYHPVAFIRRLPIIIQEDMILHPQMDKIVQILQEISNSAGITKDRHYIAHQRDSTKATSN